MTKLNLCLLLLFPLFVIQPANAGCADKASSPIYSIDTDPQIIRDGCKSFKANCLNNCKSFFGIVGVIDQGLCAKRDNDCGTANKLSNWKCNSEKTAYFAAHNLSGCP